MLNIFNMPTGHLTAYLEKYLLLSFACFFNHLKKRHLFLVALEKILIAACRCFLAAVSRGYSPVAVHGLLTAVASLVVEHGL